LAGLLKIRSSAKASSGLLISQKGIELCAERDGVAKLALPYHKYAPAHPAKCLNVALVARFIGCQFLGPERSTRFGQRSLPATSVLVPKAAVDEYRFSPPRKHEVGASGQIAAMQPKSVPQFVYPLSHDYFRFRVLTANARHHPATLGRHRWINRSCHFSFERRSLRH
jgi:hypothetical protein